MNLKQFHLISFLLGLALGGAVVVLWFLGGSAMPATFSDTTFATSTNITGILIPSGAVAVSDQVAGDSVTVDSVTVPPPGVWVAVRETGIGNQLGNVLGATRSRGPMSRLTIQLLRETTPGQVYAVELYRADDDAPFDAAIASVYVDFDTGARVVALFTAK